MSHKWDSLNSARCLVCGLTADMVFADSRLVECRPSVVVGLRPRPRIIVEKFDGSKVTITPDETA